MAVHVPLSVAAQMEARLLMLSSHNILHPANGNHWRFHRKIWFLVPITLTISKRVAKEKENHLALMKKLWLLMKIKLLNKLNN